MAIIYSYPLAEEVTNDSWVLGSEMENGLRVVKNYSVGDIAAFIQQEYTTIPTLQEVTGEGANTTIQMQINGVDVATLDDIALTLAEVLAEGNTTGGENIVINNADAIELENTSSLKKGTYNFGGNGGISRICSNNYEDMWQNGFRHVFDQSGFIRNSTNCFDIIPDETFDDTLRFKDGSIWTLDDGTSYICTDATTGAAEWELANQITLQEVLDFSHSLVGGKNFQGTGAGLGATGNNINAFGTNAALFNSGDALNALGNTSGNNNSGNNVNAFGDSAGTGNTFDYVNLLGQNAYADEDGQTVLSKDGEIMARISTTDLTATRKYNLPDASGTIALTNDIPTPAYKVYTALINQSGAAAPSVISVLENTLGGTVTFEYTNPGLYNAVLAGEFTSNKTTAILWGGTYNQLFKAAAVSLDRVLLVTYNTSGIPANDQMGITTLEIRVYN